MALTQVQEDERTKLRILKDTYYALWRKTEKRMVELEKELYRLRGGQDENDNSR